MAYWRIKLRNGTYGQDMWDQCRREHVAAITYTGIQNVDLRLYSISKHPPEWDLIGSAGAKGSITHFAWEIRGGDTIYVGDSGSHQIVGMGYTNADIGELAYRFDAHSRISPLDGHPWCHLVNVDWDSNFVPFTYKDRAPQTTVLGLKEHEIRNFEQASRVAEHLAHGLAEKNIPCALLLETSYPRYTPATQRLIHRKHVILSNCFKRWLAKMHNIQVSQERGQIDATFTTHNQRFLAEFKIAYQGDTKRAIREALGQILEYNHYPPRTSHDYWLLILDTPPSGEDVLFVQRLRDKYNFPLSLGWQNAFAFVFEPSLHFLTPE